MILGDAHARHTRSTGLVGMNAWSNAIANDVDVIVDVIADDIVERGNLLYLRPGDVDLTVQFSNSSVL